MPGHAGSPFWAAVDFDSEGDEESTTSPNNRLYLDPWDTQAYGLIQGENTESNPGEHFDSVGESVGASFYYVPTKNYDAEEEIHPHARNLSVSEIISPDYALYGRKKSRGMIPEHHSDMSVYGDRQMGFRRRSVFIEEPVYEPYPLLYEPTGYAPLPMLPLPLPVYLPPPPRSHISLPHHPEYVGFGKSKGQSRVTDPYEYSAYESLSPEYEDWAHPFPKPIPENFHLSRYGHLQIDYSFSWNSLDRLIRHK